MIFWVGWLSFFVSGRWWLWCWWIGRGWWYFWDDDDRCVCGRWFWWCWCWSSRFMWMVYLVGVGFNLVGRRLICVWRRRRLVGWVIVINVYWWCWRGSCVGGLWWFVCRSFIIIIFLLVCCGGWSYCVCLVGRLRCLIRRIVWGGSWWGW